MSSVSGLKLSPRTTIRLPFTPPTSFSILGNIACRCRSLTSTTASTIRVGESYSLPITDNARVSFGKQEPPKPGPGCKKLAANPPIHADSAGDVVNVAADFFAQVGDFVDEGNLRRQKGIRRVLSQFRAFDGSDDERRFD